MVHNLLLPTYLQTVHSLSAVQSGLAVLPMALITTFSITITGFTVSAYGYHIPFLRAGPLLYLAGSFLFWTLSASSTRSQYMGYQVLAAAGFGTASQGSTIAILAVIKDEDLATACGTEIIFNLLGGAVGASLAQNLFVSSLTSKLQSVAPREEAQAFARGGLNNMIETIDGLDGATQTAFKTALSDSIRSAFIVPIVATSVAVVVSWLVPWRKFDRSENGARVVGVSASSREE